MTNNIHSQITPTSRQALSHLSLYGFIATLNQHNSGPPRPCVVLLVPVTVTSPNSRPLASGTCVFSNFTKLFFEEKGRTPRLTAPMYGLVCFCCASVLCLYPIYRPTNQHLNAHAHIRPTEPVSTKFRSSRCARSICQRRTPCADANSQARTRTAAALLLKFSPAFCCLDCMKCPS